MAINLMLDNDNENIPIQVDDGNPYYVGARAYVERLSDGAKITVIDKEGTTTATVNDGADGQDGVDGSGIADISLTSTSGLVDTYTITFDNGTTETFDVTNGNGIASVEKTGTSGLIDTYTITFDNGDTETFTVTNGEKGDTGVGISSVEKTGTSGLVDTYTITFDDGDTETFTVTNGDKGDKGDTGNTGAAAGFGTVSATVDGNTGTPSVTVTTSGTDTAKNFAFAFSNLKGAKGDTGEVSEAELDAAVSDLEDEIELKIKSILPTDTASGAIAVFTDGTDVVSAKSLTVSLEPLQDLHGYDKPWSGGGGKNKLSTKTYTGVGYNPAIGTAIEPTVKDTQWSDNGDGTFSLTLASWESASLVSAPLSAGQYTIRVTTVSAGMRVGVYVVNEDGTLNRVSQIKNGTTANELISASTTLTEGQWFVLYIAGGSGVCTIKEPQLEAGSTATAYEPYSNICPISGHTECVTNVCGVNVWDEELETGTLNTTTGAKDSADNYFRAKNFIPVLSNTTYYYKAPPSSAYARIYQFDADYNLVKYTGTSSWLNKTFTTESNTCYIKFTLDKDIYGTTYNHDISINYPSTDTSYHAYNGQTYTTSLGRTVYGGTLDVVTGELVVDRVAETFDGSSEEDWRAYTPHGGFYINRTSAGMKSGNSQSGVANWLPVNTVFTSTGIVLGAGNAFIYATHITDTITEASDVSAWKSYLAEHPLQVVYPLATPQTYHLTPTEVQLLLGTNNVWSDGEVSVTYYADIQRYIEKKLNA